MKDESDQTPVDGATVAGEETKPGSIHYVIAFLLIFVLPVAVIGTVGYGIWSWAFGAHPLEEALDPENGTKTAWAAYVDEGGLNAELMFHGLYIEKATASFHGDGRIADVGMTLRKNGSGGSTSAKDIRGVLTDLCEIEDADWEIRRAPVQGGKGTGQLCSAIYVGRNKELWQFGYNVPVKASNGARSSNDRACEESLESFVRQSAERGISRGQAEAMWTETQRTMTFADIDCAEFARRHSKR